MRAAMEQAKGAGRTSGAGGSVQNNSTSLQQRSLLVTDEKKQLAMRREAREDRSWDELKLSAHAGSAVDPERDGPPLHSNISHMGIPGVIAPTALPTAATDASPHFGAHSPRSAASELRGSMSQSDLPSGGARQLRSADAAWASERERIPVKAGGKIHFATGGIASWTSTTSIG